MLGMAIGKTQLIVKAENPEDSKVELDPLRLAFSVQETAHILGVSHKTVHRLVARGLLRSSKALRHLLIPRFEIDRFLKDSL